MGSPYLTLLGQTPDGLDVFLVDGRWVRENLYIDFTQGGNGYRYDFIPKDEIWIDDDISDDEQHFVIIHEVVEQSLMADGLSYEEAHDRANIVEEDLRRKSSRLLGLRNSSYARISEVVI